MPRHDFAFDRPSRQSLESTVTLPPALQFLTNAPVYLLRLTDPTILDKVIRPCILRDFRSYPIVVNHCHDAPRCPIVREKKKRKKTTQRLSACNCKTTIARCITNTRDPLSARTSPRRNSRSVDAPVSSDRLCVGFSRRERIKRRDTYGSDTMIQNNVNAASARVCRQRHAQQFHTRCDYNMSDLSKLNRSTVPALPVQSRQCNDDVSRSAIPD